MEKKKKVILIGDSIRMGYQKFVQELLANEAEVWAPEQNGGTSQNVLKHLDEWALGREPDVIHLNCGLHDIKKAFGSDQANIPLDQYRASLEGIFRSLLAESQAKVIWALTTPVNEAWHHERKGFDRFERDVDAYNRASLEIANRLKVPVNDLFSVVMKAGKDRLLSPDGVHFTEEGSRLLAAAVADFVRRHL